MFIVWIILHAPYHSLYVEDEDYHVGEEGHSADEFEYDSDAQLSGSGDEGEEKEKPNRKRKKEQSKSRPAKKQKEVPAVSRVDAQLHHLHPIFTQGCSGLCLVAALLALFGYFSLNCHILLHSKMTSCTYNVLCSAITCHYAIYSTYIIASLIVSFL